MGPGEELEMKAQPPDSAVTGTLMKNKFRMQRKKWRVTKVRLRALLTIQMMVVVFVRRNNTCCLST